MTQRTPSMNIAQALTAARALGLERLDTQLLMLHALGRPASARAWLVAHDTDVLPEALMPLFLEYVQRRAAGAPLAYIVGIKEFFGLELHVDARVLVPRPDTETLVDWALECIADLPAATVLDLGTGSGAIALALKHRQPDAAVTAVDASAEALAVARANAMRLALDVTFLQGSWFDPVSDPLSDTIHRQFQLIVSNPPYIASDDTHLPALAHEPLQALASGPDGLDDIRTLVSQAPAHVRPGGWLLLEHGYDQALAVRALLAQAGFSQIQSRTDLAGIERCSGGQWLARG